MHTRFESDGHFSSSRDVKKLMKFRCPFRLFAKEETAEAIYLGFSSGTRRRLSGPGKEQCRLIVMLGEQYRRVGMLL